MTDTRSASCWDTTRDTGLLVLRLALGIIFMAHGAQKLFGWFGGPGFAATIQMFQSGMGVPPPLAVLAMCTEFFGGLGVLLGVLTRTAGLGLAFVMLVAVLKVHIHNGFFLAMGPGQANGFEYNLALGAMGIGLMLTGPGRFALAGDTERWLLERRAVARKVPVRDRQAV
jgi:putative oxidoreductase